MPVVIVPSKTQGRLISTHVGIACLCLLLTANLKMNKLAELLRQVDREPCPSLYRLSVKVPLINSAEKSAAQS